MLPNYFLFAGLALVGLPTSFASDEVTSLPGLSTPLCFKHYAGYVPVSASKQLFYWYTEATEEPKNKPLILWLNGGPGCSSLLGMFSELGPFVVDENLTVTLNPYAWNQVANVLYMEQPAGVGFSYPAGPTNDTVTAADTYDGLLQFFALHPDLQGRPFYIAGESYGGHYVPNLAFKIQIENAKLSPKSPQVINIVGFAVGNAYTDWAKDFEGPVPYGRYHALTSPENFQNAIAACNGVTAPCFWPRPGFACSNACNEAVTAATQDAMDGSIDVYDIYADVCPPGQTRPMTQAFVLESERRRQHQRLQAEHNGRVGTTPISPIFPTCIADYISKYLNSAAVQEAIHAKVGSTWAQCGLTGLYDFNYESVVPLYEQWASDHSLHILVYNGDTDYIVNFMGSQNWITAMNMKQVQAWTPWTGSDEQVAGYFVEYDGFSFATVKGAGHMVPMDRPVHALDLITSYLNSSALDKVPPKTFGPLCPATTTKAFS